MGFYFLRLSRFPLDVSLGLCVLACFNDSLLQTTVTVQIHVEDFNLRFNRRSESVLPPSLRPSLGEPSAVGVEIIFLKAVCVE